MVENTEKSGASARDPVMLRTYIQQPALNENRDGESRTEQKSGYCQLSQTHVFWWRKDDDIERWCSTDLKLEATPQMLQKLKKKNWRGLLRHLKSYIGRAVRPKGVYGPLLITRPQCWYRSHHFSFWILRKVCVIRWMLFCMKEESCFYTQHQVLEPKRTKRKTWNMKIYILS